MVERRGGKRAVVKEDKYAILRACRLSGKREYQAQNEEESRIYDTVSDNDYKDIVKGRSLDDDFVEDDQDGLSGYVDDGREDWDDGPHHRYESEDEAEAGRHKKKKGSDSIAAQVAKQRPKASAGEAAKLREIPGINAYRTPVNQDQEEDFMAKLIGNIDDVSSSPATLPLPSLMKRKTSMDRLSYLGASSLQGRAPVSQMVSNEQMASSPLQQPPSILVTDEPETERKKVKIESQDLAMPCSEESDFNDMEEEEVKPLQIRSGKHTQRKIVNSSAEKTVVKPIEDHSRMDLVAVPEDKASDWMQYATLEADTAPLSSDPADVEVKADASSHVAPKMLHSDLAEKDGKIRFFWIDHSEQSGIVILYGKVYNKKLQKWTSCSLTIKGIDRNLFVLPRAYRFKDGFATDLPVNEEDVQEEFDQVRTNCKIKTFAAKMVTRKYAFELKDVPDETEYLKVVYPFHQPAIPFDAQGETFSRIFGTRTSAFELLLLKRKIFGPCWLELSNAEVMTKSLTWCAAALQVESPKDIRAFTDADDNAPKESPPFVVMSLALRTVMNMVEKRLELVAASARTYNKFSLDDPTPIEKMPSMLHTFVRPLGGAFPVGFEAAASRSRDKIECCKVERLLIVQLLQCICKLDPDFIVGHELAGVTLDVLVSRMGHHNVDNWHRLGRLRQPKGKIPTSRYGIARAFAGRLYCDLNNEGPRSMIQSTTWSLTEMCQTHLNIQRPEFDPEDTAIYLDSAATTPDRFMVFVKQLQADTYFVAAIMSQVQLLPLTKQLTNLAGSGWSSTLTAGGRSERNEFILLHEFHREKYICPDKIDNVMRRTIKAEEDDNEAGNSKGKKEKYKGGLVFEPKRGLHDKIVLVMDFNSLYPSIIQEYNICFTTVERNIETADENGEERVPDVPNPDVKLGILPRMIATLVNRRYAVKKLMKDRNVTPAKMLQYDIKQKALKLTANSMYGCLGFKGSRFYAKPLAMLTTFKGREILTSTKELAEGNNLNVIYGDTDSVMINTNVLDLVEAQKTGNMFKKLVNERYQKLEIDIDAIFQRLLLLQKKKYAALKVEQVGDKVHIEKEIKGLDMKRREFSELSKDISDFVLSQILSGEATETCVSNIYEFLTKIGQDIRNGTIPMEKYIINKRLGKNPEEYPDGKSQPHVVVALRMKTKGASAKMGDVIPYIFCASGDSKSNPAERAHHPDDLRRAESELQIDYTYYLSTQILPPIERLCDHIEGIERPRLAECLGLDPHRYQSHAADDESSLQLHTFGAQLTDAERFRGAQSPRIKCPSCQVEIMFTGLLGDAADSIFTSSGIICSSDSCRKSIAPASIYTQLVQCIQSYVRMYYEGWLVCNDPACDRKTLAMSVYGWHCLRPDCKGQMSSVYSDTALYTQLLYMDSLFDVDRAVEKAVGSVKHEVSKVLAERYRQLCETKFRSIIKRYLDRNGRHCVDMKSLFSYMTVA